jgi:hypothetical protein
VRHIGARTPASYSSRVSTLDVALSVALGLGLATAVGLRVFLPLLVTSIAAYTGHLHLADNFVWLGTLPALIMLGVAAFAEVLAYYIPAVDNLLDVIATPTALVAGTLVSGAVITDLPPALKWATAIIAGGGAAGITHGLTAVLRAKSTVLTGGLANSAVATAEVAGSLLLTTLALTVPFLALAVAALLCWLAVRFLRKVRRGRLVADHKRLGQ